MNLHDANSSLGLKQSGDARVSAKVCSRCQQRVAEYRFTTRDGFSVATYHCAEHGDVVPLCGVDVRDDPRLH